MTDHPFDPARFDASRASEALRGLVELIESGPRALPAGEATPEVAEAIRAGFAQGLFMGEPSTRAEDRTIPGPGGDLRLRIFRPEGEVRGAMLHVHGGGWVLGRPEMNDAANERDADALGIAVVSVDYRLAPEHPYPAAPDDCEAAARWLVKHGRAELGAPEDRLVVSGESAGAHLAAVTAIRMARRHGFVFRAANLVYGLYDFGGVPSHRAFDDRNLLLDSAGIDWSTRCFVPDPARRRDPDVSPLYADLADLPPALFTVGTLDPLMDHSLFLYARWAAAGNAAELQVFPGAPHGFDAFPVPEGLQARARMREFLRAQLAG